MDAEEPLNYKSLCLSVFPSSTGRQLRQTAAPPSDPRNKRHFTENIRATNKEISIKSTQQQFWHVFSPHSGLLCSLCLICVHLHHPVSQKRWIIRRLQLLRISAGASGRACVQLLLCSFSSHRSSGLISPGPLCFICRPHGVRRPDWLWHRRSKANWINTITRILIVLNVFFSSWKHTNRDRHKQTLWADEASGVLLRTHF